MCSNICPRNSIKMMEDSHGFVYPVIDQAKCIDCGICKKNCPSNSKIANSNTSNVYAAWNNQRKIRKNSTSGGVFSSLAEYVLDQGGVVAGVIWASDFTPKHVIIDSKENLNAMYGSKYAQSQTGEIYKETKKILSMGKMVLFSGTPCQNAALKSFLGKEYENLITIDVVCHGVPSSQMLKKYYWELNTNSKPVGVKLRYKNYYWDYTYVKIDFKDGTKYKKMTIDDAYFNLFNVGFSLRNSCHTCQYANLTRTSDITLADFWGYTAHNIKTRNYNRGTSMILTNTAKGEYVFNQIKSNLFYEPASIEVAKQGNQCLSEPFDIDEIKLAEFWNDVENGMSVKNLNRKYTKNTFQLPRLLFLRREYKKWRWIIKKQ